MINVLKKAFSYLIKTESKQIKVKNYTVFNNPLVIVDIGCRWGFADKFIGDSNNISIYGFDPDIEECERLEKLYNNKNIKLIPIGLADSPGKRLLHITNEPARSSLYKPDELLTEQYPALSCAKEVSQIEVEVSTLDIWANEIGLQYIDYVKIDTQGAEFSILNGATTILKSIRFLEIEVEFNPIYTNQPIFSEIDIFLRQYGFVLWKFSNLVHYGKEGESDIILSKDTINYDHHRLEHEVRGGQIYWADAFYIRKEIVNTTYDINAIEQIKRDSEIAYRLGFIDLKYRLDKLYESRESI